MRSSSGLGEDMTDTLGFRLRIAREAAEMEFWHAYRETNLYMGRYERGEPVPQRVIIIAARVYNVREEWLRTGQEPMREEETS